MAEGTPVIPIHYDCDPGQDDAVALLYALGSKTIDVRSISVVGGNVEVAQCARNAMQILDLAGRDDLDVYIGATGPLCRPLMTLPEVFGLTGMAGAEDLPPPRRAATPLGSNGLKCLAAYTDLVATGPLTNLAMQLQAEPGLADRIERLTVMGGCPYPEPLRGWMGNYRPPGADDYAEYNFAVDPEAASIVFQAGIKSITLIGLNVTRLMLYDGAIESRLRRLPGRVAQKTADILSTLGDDDVADYGHLRAYPGDPVRAMHDVLAMAALDVPEIFTFETVPLRIAIDAPPAAAGQSVIDGNSYDHPAVRVATGIDKAAFIERMLENISRLG